MKAICEDLHSLAALSTSMWSCFASRVGAGAAQAFDRGATYFAFGFARAVCAFFALVRPLSRFPLASACDGHERKGRAENGAKGCGRFADHVAQLQSRFFVAAAGTSSARPSREPLSTFETQSTNFLVVPLRADRAASGRGVAGGLGDFGAEAFPWRMMKRFLSTKMSGFLWIVL